MYELSLARDGFPDIQNTFYVRFLLQRTQNFSVDWENGELALQKGMGRSEFV